MKRRLLSFEVFENNDADALAAIAQSAWRHAAAGFDSYSHRWNQADPTGCGSLR